jgi:DnaJ-class molecular chaperone
MTAPLYTKYRPCGPCYGSGRRYYDMSIDPSRSREEHECEDCKGTGMVLNENYKGKDEDDEKDLDT